MAKRFHVNPLLEHACMMQSGFVQARMAQRFARPASRVYVRSFDDGHDVGSKSSMVMPNGGTASQCDVLSANPSLKIAAYESVSVTATTDSSKTDIGNEYDVAAANPSFNPTLYEVMPDEPQDAEAATEQPAEMPSKSVAPTAPTTPSRKTPHQKSSARSDSAGRPTPTVRAGSFTARQLDKLVQDEEFRSDLDAIMGATDGGPKKPTPTRTNRSALATRRQTPGSNKQPGQSSARSRVPTAEEAAREVSDAPDQHAIFDKIAENMQFATAYELPSVNLSRRFDSFDRQSPRRPPVARSNAQSRSAAAAPEAAQSPSTPEPIAADKQDVAPAVPPAEPPPVPPAPPQTLRPYSETEKVATYGDPRIDPEAWAAENVIEVQVPQLASVPGPDGAPFDGTVTFHKLGMRSLSDLFAAWELAGLMSKVKSFDAGHAAQSPHGEGVDAHAWAIAFDINAKWNPAGDDPVPMEAEGSVAELVEIANQHGFIWGGHSPRRIAGLHFELGQRI